MSENNIIKNIPQLYPVFSYKVKGGGDIYVYMADTQVCRFAVISFDDTVSEVVYAVETIQGAYKIEARLLVEKAVKEWGEDLNPFKQLLKDKKELNRLANLFYARIMLW
jgi:hypothetical protein